MTKCKNCGAEIKNQLRNSTIKPKLCMKCYNKSMLERSNFNSKVFDLAGGTSKSPVKRKKSTPEKKLNKKLDEAWSKLVKLQAGNKCEYCHKTTTLNSHHIFSRANYSVRWNTANGVCLCVSHHTFNRRFSAHLTPTEFTDWITQKRGVEFMNTLRVMARSQVKYHTFEKEVLLNDLKKRIKSYEQT
jgi:hypothetical protein